MENNKHKAIFKGETSRKIYYAEDLWWYKRIANRNQHISWDNIYSAEIDKPLFELAEQVYIDDLDKLVTIGNRVRTTNGEYLYYIYDYNVIEDEETKESKIKVEQELERIYNEQKKPSIAVQKFEKPKKKWWQFWK